MKRQLSEGQGHPPVCAAYPILQCMAYLARQWLLYGARDDRPLNGHTVFIGSVDAGGMVIESRFICDLSALTIAQSAVSFEHRCCMADCRMLFQRGING